MCLRPSMCVRSIYPSNCRSSPSTPRGRRTAGRPHRPADGSARRRRRDRPGRRAGRGYAVHGRWHGRIRDHRIGVQMSVLAVGLSHRSSPVALLERAALDGEERLKLMAEMAASPVIGEVMMVSTCNRTEVYAEVDKFHPALTEVIGKLSERTGISTAELTEHAYVHYEDRAVQHLFSVACGLDSMVVGEGQILGQVRNALKDAQHGGTLGRVLNDLGQRALRVGKRAHTETHLDHAG